jgi:hypothetical protein
MTARAVTIVVLAAVGFAGVAGAQAPAAATKKAETKQKQLTTKDARFTFIQKAQIWARTNVSERRLVSRVGIDHVGEPDGRSRVAENGPDQPTRTT